MNISSTICWKNIYNPNNLVNVGPNVICLHENSVLKFTHLVTGLVSYFRAETVGTGLGIKNLAGHNRFPLFAFDECVLCPHIYVYKYPEMVRYVTLPTEYLLFTNICFSDQDLLICIGSAPIYPIVVYNYRTNTKIVDHNTYIVSRRYSIILGSGVWPTIVQYDMKSMRISCYEVCLLDKEAYLHQTSDVEMGKNYMLSAKWSLCFSEDNSLYTVNDYGEFSQIIISCSEIKRRWAPSYVDEQGDDLEPKPHSLTSHRMGFLVANTLNAFYIKKQKAGQFVIEWSLNFTQEPPSWRTFVSNANGELYMASSSGKVEKVITDSQEGQLQMIVPAGRPIIGFCSLNSFKDECVVVLHKDGVAMMDLPYGKVLSEVSINKSCTIGSHRVNAFVVVGTLDGRVILIYFEKPTVANIMFELDCTTSPIYALEFYDNTVVFEDQTKVFHVVNVEYRPIKMIHYCEIDDNLLKHEVDVHSFKLVEGPRLLVMISRIKGVRAPAIADEMWIFTWGKDRRLHRREYPLPKTYVALSVQPPMGRWVTIEIIGAVANDNIIDQYMLSENNDLQWVASIKTTHFGRIINLGITKHVITWGVAGIMVQFRQHKRAKRPFLMSRYISLFFTPDLIVKAREVYNSKYLLILNAGNVLTVSRLPSLADNIRENTELVVADKYMVPQTKLETKMFVPLSMKMEVKEEYTNADLAKRDRLLQIVLDFSNKVTALINYDISVTGKTAGIFKKFCYHYKWMEALTEEANKLCVRERESLMRAIDDQSRIRDWIRQLVTRDAVSINYKVRSIFTEANFESFSLLRKSKMETFDKYRFYDLEDHIRLSVLSLEELDEPEAEIAEIVEEEDEMVIKKPAKDLKIFVVEGHSVYDHIMNPQFQLQDKHTVTSNQIYNDNCKFSYYIADPLKLEFNKHFHAAQQMKQETIDSVLGTNNVLNKIYDNMNIMLRLLRMEQFELPELTVPRLAKDEIIKCIMEVDDSEVKAINRRRKKTIDLGGKKGRLLLWSIEFWARALIVMMDGVIEKLWEEEIKKDIPVPEFVLKKQPHEFTLEEQRIYRAYEEAVVLLEADRRKYLGILNVNEAKTLQLKTKHILKLNQRIAELMVTKLKYDFALSQNLLRMLNLKTINHVRDELRKTIRKQRNDIDKLSDYISRTAFLHEFWERSLADVRVRLDNQQTKDRTLDRQFRNNFLNTVMHASHELTKLFKKRPKSSNKLFSSTLICNEVATRLVSKQKQTQTPFPLPPEVIDYITAVGEMDQQKNCQANIDVKSWETFVRLRRQKIESELRLKGIGYQLIDCQNYVTNLTNDAIVLKDTKAKTEKQVHDNIQHYLEAMRNMTLQVTLTLGQIEVDIEGDRSKLKNSVLMHVDDINDVNSMIREAGLKKIKAMQRVAIFRRKVIFKEWEHKLYKANIAYLKYMLDAIQRCKVTVEFLNILRRWEKVKGERQKFMAAGAIDRIIEQKIAVFRKQIDRVNLQIDVCKAKTLEFKRHNHVIDAKIEKLKIDVAFQNAERDIMMEQRRDREQRERMEQIKIHRKLLDNVRKHYAHVLELQTIVELLRLRTYPTLGPPLPQCHPPVPEHILKSVP